MAYCVEASTFLRRHRTCAVIRPTFAVIQLADTPAIERAHWQLVAFAYTRAAGSNGRYIEAVRF
jgi:hypothetical protein